MLSPMLVCSLCPSVPPGSSFHFPASDFPHGSLKSSSLLICPLLSFSWLPMSPSLPLPSPLSLPSPPALCSSAQPPSSISLYPHLSSWGLSLQGSPFHSPLLPSTAPSPLSCLPWLLPELGSPSSSAPSLSPLISSCSGGAGTHVAWDLHRAAGSRWLAGRLPPCRSKRRWLEALALAFHLPAALGNHCQSQQAQSSVGSSPIVRGLFIMKTGLLD